VPPMFSAAMPVEAVVAVFSPGARRMISRSSVLLPVPAGPARQGEGRGGKAHSRTP
jgi:hypothetical protein